MTSLQRAMATLLLVASILGAVLVPYPLAHGNYVVGTAVAVLVIAGFGVFRRVTIRTLGYSIRLALVGAMLGLVISGNILVRTEIGKPGGSRTDSEQGVLLMLVCLAGTVLAFLASHVTIRLDPKARRGVPPEGERDNR